MNVKNETKVQGKPVVVQQKKGINKLKTGPTAKIELVKPPTQTFVAYSMLGAWKNNLSQVSPLAVGWFSNNLNSTLLNNSNSSKASNIQLYQSIPNERQPHSQLFLSLSQLVKLKEALINYGVEPEKVHSTFQMNWLIGQNSAGKGMSKVVFNTSDDLKLKHIELVAAMSGSSGVRSRSHSTSTSRDTSRDTSRESSPRLPINKLSIKGVAAASSTGSSTPKSTPTSGTSTPSILGIKSISLNPTSTFNSNSSLLIPAVKAFSKRSNSLLEPLPTRTPSTSQESSPEPSFKKVKTKLEIEQIEMKNQSALSSKKVDLEICRKTYEEAVKNGGAAFLALDVETWERSHGALLEFGWSFVDFETRKGNEEIQIRREDQHIIVKENIIRRNGKFSPDARDHFDFGTSIILPQAGLFNLLHALFETLSSSTPLFLLLHDDRSDLKSLHQIGFETNKFLKELSKLSGKERNNIFVVDTQKVYAAWVGKNFQVRLSTCCEVLEVPTRRLHNAGNDAHYTLNAFERLMDRNRLPPPLPPAVEVVAQPTTNKIDSSLSTDRKYPKKY